MDFVTIDKTLDGIADGVSVPYGMKHPDLVEVWRYSEAAANLHQQLRNRCSSPFEKAQWPVQGQHEALPETYRSRFCIVPVQADQATAGRGSRKLPAAVMGQEIWQTTGRNQIASHRIATAPSLARC